MMVNAVKDAMDDIRWTVRAIGSEMVAVVGSDGVLRIVKNRDGVGGTFGMSDVSAGETVFVRRGVVLSVEGRRR